MKMVTSDVLLLAEKLKEEHLTLSIAESCTGGLLSSMFTELSGASEFFIGSSVTYSDNSKIRVLGVKEETLNEFGAVSKETAREMASGARTLFGTDISVSVTGIAGPSGGTESKPLGLVFIAVSDRTRCSITENNFKGSRNEVQSNASDKAVKDILEFIGQYDANF